MVGEQVRQTPARAAIGGPPVPMLNERGEQISRWADRLGPSARYSSFMVTGVPGIGKGVQLDLVEAEINRQQAAVDGRDAVVLRVKLTGQTNGDKVGDDLTVRDDLSRALAAWFASPTCPFDRQARRRIGGLVERMNNRHEGPEIGLIGRFGATRVAKLRTVHRERPRPRDVIRNIKEEADNLGLRFGVLVDETEKGTAEDLKEIAHLAEEYAGERLRRRVSAAGGRHRWTIPRPVLVVTGGHSLGRKIGQAAGDPEVVRKFQPVAVVAGSRADMEALLSAELEESGLVLDPSEASDTVAELIDAANGVPVRLKELVAQLARKPDSPVRHLDSVAAAKQWCHDKESSYQARWRRLGGYDKELLRSVASGGRSGLVVPRTTPGDDPGATTTWPFQKSRGKMRGHLLREHEQVDADGRSEIRLVFDDPGFADFVRGKCGVRSPVETSLAGRTEAERLVLAQIARHGVDGLLVGSSDLRGSLADAYDSLASDGIVSVHPTRPEDTEATSDTRKWRFTIADRELYRHLRHAQVDVAQASFHALDPLVTEKRFSLVVASTKAEAALVAERHSRRAEADGAVVIDVPVDRAKGSTVRQQFEAALTPEEVGGLRGRFNLAFGTELGTRPVLPFLRPSERTQVRRLRNELRTHMSGPEWGVRFVMPTAVGAAFAAVVALGAMAVVGPTASVVVGAGLASLAGAARLGWQWSRETARSDRASPDLHDLVSPIAAGAARTAQRIVIKIGPLDNASEADIHDLTALAGKLTTADLKGTDLVDVVAHGGVRTATLCEQASDRDGYDSLQDIDVTQVMDTPRDRMETWLLEQLAGRGLTIEPAALQTLLSTADGRQHLMEALLDRLHDHLTMTGRTPWRPRSDADRRPPAEGVPAGSESVARLSMPDVRAAIEAHYVSNRIGYETDWRLLQKSEGGNPLRETSEDMLVKLATHRVVQFDPTLTGRDAARLSNALESIVENGLGRQLPHVAGRPPEFTMHPLQARYVREEHRIEDNRYDDAYAACSRRAREFLEGFRWVGTSRDISDRELHDPRSGVPAAIGELSSLGLLEPSRPQHGADGTVLGQQVRIPEDLHQLIGPARPIPPPPVDGVSVPRVPGSQGWTEPDILAPHERGGPILDVPGPLPSRRSIREHSGVSKHT